MSPTQLEHLANGATTLRRQIEGEIITAPASPAAMAAFMRLPAEERASQRDLTAASAHLAQASALLYRVADRSSPIIDLVAI